MLGTNKIPAFLEICILLMVFTMSSKMHERSKSHMLSSKQHMYHTLCFSWEFSLLDQLCGAFSIRTSYCYFVKKFLIIFQMWLQLCSLPTPPPPLILDSKHCLCKVTALVYTLQTHYQPNIPVTGLILNIAVKLL